MPAVPASRLSATAWRGRQSDRRHGSNAIQQPSLQLKAESTDVSLLQGLKLQGLLRYSDTELLSPFALDDAAFAGYMPSAMPAEQAALPLTQPVPQQPQLAAAVADDVAHVPPPPCHTPPQPAAEQPLVAAAAGSGSPDPQAAPAAVGGTQLASLLQQGQSNSAGGNGRGPAGSRPKRSSKKRCTSVSDTENQQMSRNSWRRSHNFINASRSRIDAIRQIAVPARRSA